MAASIGLAPSHAPVLDCCQCLEIRWLIAPLPLSHLSTVVLLPQAKICLPPQLLAIANRLRVSFASLHSWLRTMVLTIR